MVSMNEDKAPQVTAPVQDMTRKGQRRFIQAGDNVENVIKWDKEGDELIFESDKGKFMALSESDITKLSKANRTSYNVSRALNEKHDPENDALQQRIKVGEQNSRRQQFESIVRTTSQGSRATKKLQAFVGEGFEPYWARTDKIEDKLAQGYEIVRPGEDIYAGVAKVADANSTSETGHFETRVKPGETELVLMRIRTEDRKRILAEKAEKASRLEATADRKGAQEITAMGGELIGKNQGGAWVDRS